MRGPTLGVLTAGCRMWIWELNPIALTAAADAAVCSASYIWAWDHLLSSCNPPGSRGCYDGVSWRSNNWWHAP